MHDRERHHDRPAPRRHLVKEIKRQQRDFRRNRGAVLPRIEIEQPEIDLRVAVGRLDAAELQDAIAQPRHPLIVHRNARQLQRKVRLHRGAHFGRPVHVDIEAAVRQLPLQNRPHGFLDFAARGRPPHAVLRRIEPKLEENVIGFERGIGRQLRAPVAVTRLQARQIRRRTFGGLYGGGLQRIFDPGRCAHRIVTISSPGSENRTSSSTSSISSISRKPLRRRKSTSSCTRCSGAEAPAVTATFFTPSNQAVSTSSQSFTRYERTPKLVPTSTSRLELELFCEPTTSSRSQASETALTAICRFSVA